MAKKKATMTLKDFHGGSIPSDLPLPSAPGVMVRHSDRMGFDRQTSWGNPMGRSDPRLRPGSAGSVRNFDDKTPFFGNNAHIGRNFDEDERKPLDAVSGPRRTVSDERIHAPPARVDVKMDHSSTERPLSRPVSSPVTYMSSGSGNGSYGPKFTGASNVGISSHDLSGDRSYLGDDGSRVVANQNIVGGCNNDQAVGGSYPNAWGLRKEGGGVAQAAPAVWSAPDAASKLAHASALDKVSSGRWHSKQPVYHNQTDVEVIRHPESVTEIHATGYNMYNRNSNNAIDVVVGREYHDMMLARRAETSLSVNDGKGGGKDLPAYERATSPMYSKTNESNTSMHTDGVQPICISGKFAGAEIASQLPAEVSERPKLKLLPRSKPMENLEAPVDHKHGFPHNVDPGHVEDDSELYGNTDSINPGLAGPESGKLTVERPKLNLKPRSQPLEQLEGKIERERNSLFGGARPRELVLKERGIDDVAVNNHDLSQAANRLRHDVQKTETGLVHGTPIPYNERPENISLDHRTGKNNDRQDPPVEVDRADPQRRNWRSETWKNSREIEKHQPQQRQHQNQQGQERPPSPETWRKPVEQPKPASLYASGPRHGKKAASAVELAQAFSRSVSDPKTADHLSNQRGLPTRSQMPFSRLMGPTSRAQINGY